MTEPPRILLGLSLATALTAALAAYGAFAANREVARSAAAANERADRLASKLEAQTAELMTMAREISRMRIEQRVGGQGPNALLSMLKTYAATLVDSRATQPDFQNAQDQMKSVLRAFAAMGQDAIEPLRRRFDELQPRTDFDELRWVLEALVQSDQEKGKQLVAQVLEGTLKPSPRLRWAAAELLSRTDRELARRTLRKILMTETSRGIDPDRAAAYGASIPDPAAVAATGFFNFITHYLRTEDPEAEDTLLQVLMRTDQDMATLQEAIEALGSMRSARAQKRIEELYLRPPGASQNALFLNKCLDALVAIRGQDVKPWLLEQMATAEHDLVVQHLDRLLKDLDQPQGRKEEAPSATGGSGK